MTDDPKGLVAVESIEHRLRQIARECLTSGEGQIVPYDWIVEAADLIEAATAKDAELEALRQANEVLAGGLKRTMREMEQVTDNALARATKAEAELETCREALKVARDELFLLVKDPLANQVIKECDQALRTAPTTGAAG